MKRSFSTVSCLELTYNELIETAKKNNMDGVEIRLDNNNKICGYGIEKADEIYEAFSNAGIKITDLGTNVGLLFYTEDGIRIAMECIDLASAVKATGIRVFLGSFSRYYSTYGDYDYKDIVKAVKELAIYAKPKNVEIWLETHNDFSTGEILKKVIDDCGEENVKVIWDIMHPLERGETPFETVRYLGSRIGHVHMKDGIDRRDFNMTNYLYTRLGEGEINPGEIIAALNSINYDGYLSLEFENAWRPEIREAHSGIDEILESYNLWLDTAENNIIPLVNSDKWDTFSPEQKKLARFSKGLYGESLDIEVRSESYSMGKWISRTPVEAGKTYDFSVVCKTDTDITNVYAIATIWDKDGNMLIRDHIENCKKIDVRYYFSDKFLIPDNGCEFETELWLKGNNARVSWYQPHLTAGDAKKERNVRVAIAYIEPEYEKEHTLEYNKQTIIDAIDKCGELNPDVIVLSEGMLGRGTNIPMKDKAETENGEMCSIIRKKADEYNSYLVYNFHEVEGSEYYNTSILIGRNGETVGKFRKTHLTVGEYEQGLTPGCEYPVFETDFGKVGMLICYDHYFSPTTEELVKNGAEIIFVSTAGDSAEKSVARAMDGGVYFAICGLNTENSHGWGPGRIIAPDGEIIAHTSKSLQPAFSEIDLNKKIRRFWLSLGPAQSHIKGVYKYEKNIEVHEYHS